MKFNKIFISIIFSSFLSFCNEKNEFESYSLISKMPTKIKFENGVKVFLYSIDTTGFFYSNNLAIYKFPKIVDFETNIHKENTESYFIQKYGDTSGYFLSDINDSVGQKTNIDTVLIYFGHRKNTFDYAAFLKEWKLIDKSKNYKKDNVEKYIPYSNKNPLLPDTLEMLYNRNFSKCQFSISKIIDSIKAVKLIEMNMIYNSRYTKSEGEFPPKTISVCLKKSDFEIPIPLIKFVEKKYF